MQGTVVFRHVKFVLEQSLVLGNVGQDLKFSHRLKLIERVIIPLG